MISFRQERVINYSEETVLGSKTGPLCDVELVNIEIILSRRPKSEQHHLCLLKNKTKQNKIRVKIYPLNCRELN